MTKRVARKATREERELARTLKRKNKLNSLKNELEGGKIKSFDQVFAIISESRLAAEVNITYYIFKKKVESPDEFTVGEMMRMAELIGVQYETIAGFVLEVFMGKRKG